MRGEARSGEVCSDFPKRGRCLQILPEQGNFNEGKAGQGVRNVFDVLRFLLPALGEQAASIGWGPAVDHAGGALHAGTRELADEFDRFKGGKTFALEHHDEGGGVRILQSRTKFSKPFLAGEENPADLAVAFRTRLPPADGYDVEPRIFFVEPL